MGLGGCLCGAGHSIHLLPPPSHLHAGEGQLPAGEKSVQFFIQYLSCNRLPPRNIRISSSSGNMNNMNVMDWILAYFIL